MNLPHIISKVLRDPWLITEAKHFAIMNALEGKLGGNFTALDDYGDEEPDDSDRNQYREFQTATGNIAVIPIHGILGKHLSSLEIACGGCSLDTIQNQLKTVASSSRISQVLLDINSPGGTVVGTPETAALVAQVNETKPVWAFTDSDCCSAALWLASQARLFYSTESADVGSVGVRMILLDVTRQLEEDGVKVNAIYSGKYKLLGASFKSLEPDERELLQAESDRIYQQFKKEVTAVRPVEAENLQGQIFAGEEAAGIGMTDGVVMNIEETISAMTGKASMMAV